MDFIQGRDYEFEKEEKNNFFHPPPFLKFNKNNETESILLGKKHFFFDLEKSREISNCIDSYFKTKNFALASCDIFSKRESDENDKNKRSKFETVFQKNGISISNDIVSTRALCFIDDNLENPKLCGTMKMKNYRNEELDFYINDFVAVSDDFVLIKDNNKGNLYFNDVINNISLDVNQEKANFSKYFESFKEKNKRSKDFVYFIPLPHIFSPLDDVYNSGLILADRLWPYDSKKKKFVNFDDSLPLDYESFELSLFGKDLWHNHEKILFFEMKGHVFFLKDKKLFEIVWNKKDKESSKKSKGTNSECKNSELSIIEHLYFISPFISEVFCAGEHGLFVKMEDSVKQKIQFSTAFFYDFEKMEIKEVEIPNEIKENSKPLFLCKNGDVKIIFLEQINFGSSISDELFKKVREKKTSIISLTKEDIRKMKSRTVSSLFDPEAYKKDTSFKCMSFPSDCDLSGLESISPKEKDWNYCPCEKIFQVKKGSENGFEIIAGFHCKENTSLIDIGVISSNYKEISCTGDLADYLGAPIFYFSKDYSGKKIIHRGTLLAMENSKRSSGRISFGSWKRGSWGMSSITLENKEGSPFGRGIEWLGIMSPKAGYNFKQTKSAKLTVKEIQKFFLNCKLPGYDKEKKTFDLESGKMLLIDPGYSRIDEGASLNSKKGKWKFISYPGESGSDQIIAYHESVESDSDLEPFLHDWSCPKNLYTYKEEEEREEDRKPVEKSFSSRNPVVNNWKKIDNYSKNEIGKGWLKLWPGIGADTARIMIGDENYFQKEEFLPNPLKNTKLEGFDLFTFEDDAVGSFQNLWSNMSDSLGEDFANMTYLIPFGVITQSGYGDGCYQSLVKRNKSNEIVIIRIIFCTPNGYKQGDPNDNSDGTPQNSDDDKKKEKKSDEEEKMEDD